MIAPVDALVVGRGLPELLAALDLAELGLRVALADGAEDLPETAERDSEGALARALERLTAPLDSSRGSSGGADAAGASTATSDAASASATGASMTAALLPERLPVDAPLLLDRSGAWAPQPEPAVFGIPAMPLAADALRLLGTGGALRAYLDRITPLLTIGKTRSFGELIRRRLGRAALERLSEPLLQERFGVPVAEIDTAVAAPGLNETLTRTGSLTSAALAYSDRYVARETRVQPAAGWPAAQSAALRRLELFGVERIGSAVIAIAEVAEAADGGWIAELEDGKRIEARALIVGLPRELDEMLDAGDAGRRRRTPSMLEEFPATPLRVHAEIDISSVPGLTGGDSAVRSIGSWSLRIVCAETGRCTAQLLGAAVEAGGSPPRAEEAVLSAVLGDAGLDAAAGATWRVRRIAAPFSTIAARDEAVAELGRTRDERPTLLVLGRALHGDDLSAAVAAAHHGAVELRRRLLGLTE